MDINTDTILYAITFSVGGAVLSGLAQYFANYAVTQKQGRQEQQNYRVVVYTKAESVQKQIEKLRNSLNDRGFYPFIAIKSLQNRVARMEQDIADVHKTGENTSLQQNFVSTVTDLSELMIEIDNLENHALNRKGEIVKSKSSQKIKDQELKEFLSFIDQQRAARLVELVDLNRRVGELIEAFRPTKK